jgi:hypothetical protein
MYNINMDKVKPNFNILKIMAPNETVEKVKFLNY